MEILKEALIFFTIVVLIVGGAVYLSDRAPELFSTGEEQNVSLATAPAAGPKAEPKAEVPQKPLAKVFFKATMRVEPPFSLSGRQVNDVLSITYSGGGVPFSLGKAKIKGADGIHTLVLGNYTGGLELSRSGASACRLNGSSSEVSLDSLTFSEESLPVSADLSCSFLESDAAVVGGIFAKVDEGSLNVTGNSALFSLNAGDSISMGEFSGSVRFNAVTNELVLSGFSYNVSIVRSGGGVISLS